MKYTQLGPNRIRVTTTTTQQSYQDYYLLKGDGKWIKPRGCYFIDYGEMLPVIDSIGETSVDWYTYAIPEGTVVYEEHMGNTFDIVPEGSLINLSSCWKKARLTGIWPNPEALYRVPRGSLDKVSKELFTNMDYSDFIHMVDIEAFSKSLDMFEVRKDECKTIEVDKVILNATGAIKHLHELLNSIPENRKSDELCKRLSMAEDAVCNLEAYVKAEVGK